MTQIKEIKKIVFEPIDGLTMEQWIRVQTTRTKVHQDKINEIIERLNKL
ncbi:hypothetical protein M0R04_10350 [Candidatus Dojkabacteria bacterium]|jgi:hypothetical protein|nr:hypothetical protein [Candidatus Dojkabacteria bacterium]